ncbi:hypothetical protein BKI52_17720 [marine bacterium AO1-C]|nr:hypothetical protein BKI52_17720 [marine bacterium AO1-C]
MEAPPYLVLVLSVSNKLFYPVKFLIFSKKNSAVWSIGFLLTLASCTFNNDVNVDWQPRIVAPLVNGELGVFQQPDIQDISDVFTISASDVFGTQRGTVPSLPALGAFNYVLNPTKISNNDIIDEIGVSNVRITINLRNNMPVTMASGAVVALTNSGETTPFVQQTIDRTVAPGESIAVNIEQSTAVIKNTFIASLSNLNTLASTSSVTITDNSQIELRLQFDPPTVDYIQFVAGTTNTFETTVDFDSGLDQNTDEVSGNLVVGLENQVPIDFLMAINLLDASDNIISTIFNPTLNLTANQNATETLNSQTIINSLKNAKKLQIVATFSPTVQNRRIDNTAKLKYNLVADLKLKIKGN